MKRHKHEQKKFAKIKSKKHYGQWLHTTKGWRNSRRDPTKGWSVINKLMLRLWGQPSQEETV